MCKGVPATTRPGCQDPLVALEVPWSSRIQPCESSLGSAQLVVLQKNMSRRKLCSHAACEHALITNRKPCLLCSKALTHPAAAARLSGVHPHEAALPRAAAALRTQAAPPPIPAPWPQQASAQPFLMLQTTQTPYLLSSRWL